MSYGCHRRPLESFLRQYPRQLPMWRHTLHFFFRIFFILSLPMMSFCLFFFCEFPWRICLLNRLEVGGDGAGEQAGEDGRDAASFCSPNLSVCFPLPAPEHRACKSFSCTALSQPLLAPFQKCAACFRKMEGTSLHGECCLPALVTTAVALSLSVPLCLFPSLSLPDSDKRLLFYPLFHKLSCLFRSLGHNED